MKRCIENDSTENEELVELARKLYQRKGVIEIDDDALISTPAHGGGHFVQAWVWVADEA